MKFTIIALVAWLAGLIAYPLAGLLFYRQWMGLTSGDFLSTALLSFFIFHALFLVVYMPQLCALSRMSRGRGRAWPFIVAPAVLCFLPTALLLVFWGGFRVQMFISSEAALLDCFFAISGAVAGWLYWSWIHPKEAEPGAGGNAASPHASA